MVVAQPLIHQERLRIHTGGRESIDITRDVAAVVRNGGVACGWVHVFLMHTSASLMICENADADVRRDLESFFGRLVQDGHPDFVHRVEGPDDMSAHVRSVLTHTDLTIPVTEGALALGTWQGIYLWEHRYRKHERCLTITVQGTG
jgi:secondary thiamine-phosphate synthase enzyme